ncbi:MAG TPA: protoporphyrinogen oxidase [Actinomycetota bacterium]|nr:protoporphyrinogen oxidase [Actinomycetota bacterium]
MSVVVVGGGISGLVAARTLEAAGEEVILLEMAERLGGKIVTHEIRDAVIEGGPDWFITRVPEALELCRDLGIEDRLVSPVGSGTLVLRRGKMRPFPRGFVRGIPPSARAALQSRFVSPVGALRALADYVLPGPLTGPDVSVGALVRRRLGRQVLERLVEPMLAASRSGAPDEISLAAGAPEIDAAARSSRSVMRALRREAREPAMLPPFLGVRGGMEHVVHALSGGLKKTQVMLRSEVTTIERAGSGWHVELGSGGRLEARATVIAAPAPAAAIMLRASAPEAATRLATIRYEPAAVIGLVYPVGSAPPPEGATGVVVPPSERRNLTACAWFSSKWPHMTGPQGPDVMRAFVGGDAALAEEDALVEGVAAEIATLTGAPATPDGHVITRWRHALPVMRVRHFELIDAIEAALPPGLALAGAALRGSGLPDCIRSGAAAASAVAAAER